MTLQEIHVILEDVEYEDWTFECWDENGRPIMQVQFLAPDIDSGQPCLQRGRKWFLSRHMTKSEVVGTALKAVLTAMEHEIRETFTYRGEAIFGPHFDVEALHSMAGLRRMEVRA